MNGRTVRCNVFLIFMAVAWALSLFPLPALGQGGAPSADSLPTQLQQEFLGAAPPQHATVLQTSSSVPQGPTAMPATTNITPLPQTNSPNSSLASEQPSKRPLSSASQVKSLEECEVIAKIDGQLVQACEVLWQVKMVMDKNRNRIPPDRKKKFIER